MITGRGELYYALHNDGLIESAGANGFISLIEAPITQGAAGVVRSVDGGTIGISGSSSITGGTVDGGADGRLAGAGTIADATVTGTWGINAGSTLRLGGTITGDGTLVVNRTQEAPTTDLILGDGAQVDTAVVLNTAPGSSDLSDARLYWSRAGTRPTLLPGGTIGGRGQLFYGLDVHGTLTPGTSAQAVSLLQLQSVDFDLAPTARIEIDARGTDSSEHDRIAGSGSVTLDGSLDVDFVDGYVPQPRDQFEIISGSAVDGFFADIDIEPVGAIGPAHVVYTGDSVIVVICAADRDADGELTIFDFLAFQNLFDQGDLRADLDQDGQLTIFDFLVYQNRFAAGCG